MAEIDTSSYPKAAAPVSLLDNVQKLGNLQQQKQQIDSGALSIDKQKLDLVNQRFGEMSKGFAALAADPSVNRDKIRSYITDQVKLGYVPAEMAATTISQVPNSDDPKVLKQHLLTQLQHAQTVVDALNTHGGTPVDVNDGATTYAGTRASPIKGGAITPATTINAQLPPTQPGPPGPNNVPTVLGPKAGPAGPQPVAGPRPWVAPPPGMVNDPSQGNLTSTPLRSNVATAGQPMPPPAIQTPMATDRTPVVTGAAPGVVQAQGEVATQSGKDFATALTRQKNLVQDLYPAIRVLDIIKENGTALTGVGTDGLNTLKNAIVTWFPNVDKKLVDGVRDFEEAKKQLVALSRSSGNTGTNDQLAASFEANPNTKMSTATVENVLKSVIALRRMEAAQTVLAQDQNIPADEYSKWVSKNQNVLDPRAFGFDIMTPEARKKLVDSMSEVNKEGMRVPKKGKEKEFKKFEYSVDFANQANLIEPPGMK